MLVIMALVTTGMTGPLLTLGNYWRARKPRKGGGLSGLENCCH